MVGSATFGTPIRYSIEVVTIEAFYETHIDKLYTFCLYRTGNRFVAEDLASTAFLKFFKSPWQRLENPVGYLYTICRNVIIDYYRKEKPQVSLEKLVSVGLEPSATTDTETPFIIEEVLKEMNALPEDQKEVLLLQYVQDLDNKTIAQVLGKTESAVKSLAHRGIETLRAKLNK